MKKILLISILSLVFFSAANFSYAQLQISVKNTTYDNCPPGTPVGSGCNLGYTPLEPIPGFNDKEVLSFPVLLNRIYTIAITIGALFSVLMMAISGVRYMLSDIVTDKAKAKGRIWACLYGLLIIAASWLLLNTINPQLVTFTLNPGSATITGVPQQTNTNNTQACGANSNSCATGYYCGKSAGSNKCLPDLQSAREDGEKKCTGNGGEVYQATVHLECTYTKLKTQESCRNAGHEWGSAWIFSYYCYDTIE